MSKKGKKISIWGALGYLFGVWVVGSIVVFGFNFTIKLSNWVLNFIF